MRVLGFDTATRATTVALLDSRDGTAVQARDDPDPGQRPRHTTRLMPLIAEVLERADIGWDDVDRLAVGLGPGTFTGLRIGIATAKGLAGARAIPLVGISTLQSLALNARFHSGGPSTELVLPVLDARRGEVFAAAWRRSEIERREAALMAPIALTPEGLEARMGELGSSVLAVGDGAVEFRQTLEGSGALVPDDASELHRVTAVRHCTLATRLPPTRPDEVLPDYLRLPDAEIARRAAGNQ
jgi:tRNA threonylcarbamoyladenosine biosynthesis protein TsaB